MRELGRIARLQVQCGSIKTGTRPFQTYTPVPNLTSVQTIRINADGVEGIGENGETLPDMHNAAHPQTKFTGDNGISIGFTGHYATMRTRFGDHMTDGIAGENIVVANDGIVSLDMLEKGIVIVGDSGEVRIGPWVILHPCAPFTKFCLGIPGDTKPDRRVTEGLQFLEHGLRGFSAVYGPDLPPVEIRVGDLVYALDE